MKSVGERVWDFSWARTKSMEAGRSMFRWRDKESGDEYLCEEIRGATDGPNSYLMGEGDPDHLMILADLWIDDEGDRTVAYVYPPATMPEDAYEAVQELPASHYRMCARLSDTDFRCRDERTGALRHVRDFVGPASLNWIDHGSHVFHDGAVVIDTENVAHLVPA